VSNEVKRIKVYHLRETFCPRALLVADESPMPDNGSFLIQAEDHERIGAELKAQLEHSETKVSWLLRDNERVLKEKDAAYNELDDINMALNEKIAKQKRVLEKLKDVVTCVGCAVNESCPYAWDGYNTNGDCLAEK